MGKSMREGAAKGSRGPDDEAAERRGLEPHNANPWVRDVLMVFLDLNSPVDCPPSEAVLLQPGQRVLYVSTGGQTTARYPEAIHLEDDRDTLWI